MWAILGNMIFEILEAPLEMEETERFNYAEHEVLKGKAKLQRLGSKLKEITLTLKLSFLVSEPEETLEKLNELAHSEEPLEFTLGNGKFLGTFVIEEIKKVWKETDNEGNIQTIEVELKLKEAIQ